MKCLLAGAILALATGVGAQPLVVTKQPGELHFHAITGGRAVVAQVALQHDGANLLLEYRVQDDTPLLNRGQDPLHHFKEGDAVDLRLGPWREPAAQPVAGDLRLLLVPLTPPVAVLYRQVDPQATAAESVEFSSPVRKVTFGSVRHVTNVSVSFTKTSTGYTCRARVPFTVLGIVYHPGLRLRGDVGVLFSNEGGLLTERRCNLFDAGNTTVSDIPTEVELTPAGWGEFVLE